MKKILYILGILATSLVAFSCTKDEGSVEGRWNGYEDGSPDSYVVSFFLNEGNSADIWVIAWGEKYECSYVMNGSNITFSINKAWRSEKRDEYGTESGIVNGSITSQETFALGVGFQWYELATDEFAQRKQDVSDTFSLIVDSATTGHGAVFGRQLLYAKAK